MKWGGRGASRIWIAHPTLSSGCAGGDAFGQYRLGEVYLRGAGVKRDLHEAFHWMELAARNGDVPAMLKVGILHLMGVNGRVELVRGEAVALSGLAKGNKMALQVLQEMALAEGRSAFDFNGQSFLNAGWDQRLAVTLLGVTPVT